MMLKRFLRKEESDLIKAMIKGKPQAASIISQLPDLMFEEMNDGGMGSLRVVSDRNRSFGGVLVETELVDEDNVPIIITINLDDSNNLYELDIWKVDFSPLKRFPKLA